MKRFEKKLLKLTKIYEAYENQTKTKSKLEIKIKDLQNIIEDDKYNKIINAFNNYKIKIFYIFARTNRVFIRINTTPQNLLNLSRSEKITHLNEIFKAYANYYNMELLDIYEQISSLKLILTENELNEIIENINTYKNYIINILSYSHEIGIYSKQDKPKDLYYYDVFKIPD